MRKLKRLESQRLRSQHRVRISTWGPDTQIQGSYRQAWTPTFCFRLSCQRKRTETAQHVEGSRAGSQATLGSVSSFAAHLPGTMDKEFSLSEVQLLSATFPCIHCLRGGSLTAHSATATYALLTPTSVCDRDCCC